MPKSIAPLTIFAIISSNVMDDNADSFAFKAVEMESVYSFPPSTAVAMIARMLFKLMDISILMVVYVFIPIKC